MERKKIAFITNNAGYTPDSAMGIYTWLLACGLSERGFDVDYYCRGNYVKENNYSEHVKIISFSPDTFWKNVVSSIKKEGTKTVLYHYLATVWGWNGIPYQPPIGIARLKLSGVNVITNFHETNVRWTFNKPWILVQGITQRIASLVLLKSSKCVISSIDFYVRDLGRYNKNVYKIPIASNILPSHNREYYEAYKKDYREKHVSKDEILICCFGNRDCSVLIESVNGLLKANYNIRVIFIGHISEMHVVNMRQLIDRYKIDDHFFFTGLLSQDEVYNYLAVSDIIFSYEGIKKGNKGGASFKSGSLVASFSIGAPIITTKGDLNDDNFNNIVPLFLFDAKDSEALKRLIKQLIDDPAKRKEAGAKTLEFFDSYLSWEKIIDRHVDVFDACSSSKKQ